MSRLLAQYTAILQKYPFASQSISTGVLVACGDIIAQKAVERQKWNPKRTIQFFGIGLIYLGPTLTVWYRALDRIIGTGGKYYGFKKMALDQGCFAPFFLGGFVFGANLVQGKSLSENVQAFKDKYPGILLNNYKVWPAVQAINFSLLPLHYQVLFVQIVSLFWNTYLCYTTRPDDKSE